MPKLYLMTHVVIAYPSKQQPEILTQDDLLPIPDFVTLQLTVADLFSWLKLGGNS